MPTGIPQTVPVAEGGTGAKTASAARTNLGISSAALLSTYLADTALNFAEIAGDAEETLTVTVTGAVIAADYTGIAASWGAALEAGIVVKQIWLSADNTVSVTARNTTATPINPASIGIQLIVFQFTI